MHLEYGSRCGTQRAEAFPVGNVSMILLNKLFATTKLTQGGKIIEKLTEKN